MSRGVTTPTNRKTGNSGRATLKELPDPEETRIDCEKCNTEGWLQEEPKGFELLNTNRGAQEEGGQTYSYASGTIEEGPGTRPPGRTEPPSDSNRPGRRSRRR